MKRYDVIDLSKLSKGDCFYKLDDGKKKSYALIQHGAAENEYVAVPSEFYGNRFQNQKTEKINEDIKVVYLRSIK